MPFALLPKVPASLSPDNLDPFEKRLQYAGNRDVLDRFSEASARHNVAADLEMIGHYDTLLQRLELEVLRKAKVHDPQARFLLRTIPGVGEILSHVPLMLRECAKAKQFVQRKEKKHGKSRAMTMLARKIGRAVYQMLKRKEAFDSVKFFAN